MKSETKIAEEKIKVWEEIRITKDGNAGNSCREHKASCQRFLEFLEKETEPKQLSLTFKELKKSAEEHIWEKKITDLKNAIKKYVEAGI